MGGTQGHSWLLEDNSGDWLLENGSGVWLLETAPAPITMNNYLSVAVGDGMTVSEKIR